MNKKISIIIIISITICLSSCSVELLKKDNSEKASMSNSDNKEIHNVTNEFYFSKYDLKLDLNHRDDNSIQMDNISEELAVKLADTTLSYYYDSILEETNLIDVLLSEDDSVYIVARQLKGCTLDGGYYVAIRKKDGAILKVWTD